MLNRRQFLKLAAAGAALPTGLGSYAFAIEPRFRLVAVTHEVATPQWRLPPLRIVALADIHACEPWMPVSRIQHIVEAANRLEGDIVLLLGDYVPGLRHFRTSVVPPQDWAAALAALRAPLGAHAVLGNHDWWSDAPGVRAALESAGIAVYQNHAARLAYAGEAFWLAGTDSMIARRGRGKRHRGADDLPGTLIQLTDDAPAVLMAHEPDMFARVPPDIALTLSGHTHGGQVFLPFVGRPAVPTRYGERYAWGHVREAGRDLVVSGGLGCSVVPVRFGVPPEITVVTLRGTGGHA